MNLLLNNILQIHVQLIYLQNNIFKEFSQKTHLLTYFHIAKIFTI